MSPGTYRGGKHGSTCLHQILTQKYIFRRIYRVILFIVAICARARVGISMLSLFARKSGSSNRHGNHRITEKPEKRNRRQAERLKLNLRHVCHNWAISVEAQPSSNTALSTIRQSSWKHSNKIGSKRDWALGQLEAKELGTMKSGSKLLPSCYFS